MLEKRKILKYLELGYDRALIDYAHELRIKNMGEDTIIRGIIEFSNICARECEYCGIRGKHKIERYRMDVEEIIETAKKAYDDGYQTVVLQSGEDNFYTKEKVCAMIGGIKSSCPDLAITLSIGERDYEEYKAFKEAGADRYLLKFETSDKKLYEKMHPSMSFENRIQCLKNLKSLGFETGSGVMIGLPGQSLESIADDILLFNELQLDMIGTGPYVPHPETPLGKEFVEYPHSDMNKFMQTVLALIRLVNPYAHIPATTAFVTINQEEGRNLALHSGANVVMLNVTPMKYKKLYEIYPDKACLRDKESCIKLENLV